MGGRPARVRAGGACRTRLKVADSSAGFRRQVGEGLQQRDGDGQEPAALLFGVVEPAAELVCPDDDHVSKYELQLI